MPQNNTAKGVSPNSNPTFAKKRIRKAKFTRKSVLNMLAVMEASQNVNQGDGGAGASPPTPDGTVNAQEFLSSGRTGRRNALPDILGQHAAVTSSDLPSRLQALTTKDKATDQKQDDGASTSKS